jgi:hypothetical protein
MSERISEAEELLRVGKMIRPRVGLRAEGGGLILAGFKPGGFLLYEDDEPLDHFDLDGRWQRCFRGGRHTVKRLDGGAVAVDRERKGRGLEVSRTLLPPEETAQLDREIRESAQSLREALAAKALRFVPPPDGETALDAGQLADFLDRILAWDDAAWEAQRLLHERAYGALGPIPPGCATALPLRAMVDGRSRTDAEFRAHLEDIRAAWKRRAEQCGACLLLEPDAWRLGFGHLREKAGAIRDAFGAGGTAPEGFHLILEDYEPGALPPGSWEEAAEAGVVRAHLRMPIGGPLKGAVASIRGGGIPVDLLLDDPAADEIRGLDLGRGDRIVVFAGDARRLREELATWLKERKAAVIAAAEGL